MSAPIRWAVYLAPPPESALWRFGSDVIGRDAASGERNAGFALDGFDAAAWRALTSEPRRYGFHATLKAPFRLAEGREPHFARRSDRRSGAPVSAVRSRIACRLHAFA